MKLYLNLCNFNDENVIECNIEIKRGISGVYVLLRV